MIITKEELIELLEKNNIKDMNIEMSLTTETKEDIEQFFTDKIKGYSNERIYTESRDLLTIEIKTFINHNKSFVGFAR